MLRELVANAGHVFVVLAKAARIFRVPVILTAVESSEFSGHITPQLLELFPDQAPIERTTINAWDNERFVAAVKNTKRKNFLIAALWSDAGWRREWRPAAKRRNESCAAT